MRVECVCGFACTVTGCIHVCEHVRVTRGCLSSIRIVALTLGLTCTYHVEAYVHVYDKPTPHPP